MILKGIIRSLRPQQWIKNGFIFSSLIFSQNIFDLSLLLKTFAAFWIFCALSGSVYILNDIMDLEEDRRHPHKSKRPLASGDLGKKHAVFALFVLSFAALASAYVLNLNFFFAASIYLILQIAYSFKLKHVVIIDVFIIAVGFFIRVVAGGLVIEVEISHWLLLCTLLLSLFLGFSKRRHELILLDENPGDTRPILKEYSPTLLDQMIAIVTASTVISYCLYTISEDTVAKFGTTKLIYTVPFVLYGIFRYLYLIHQKFEGGSPEAMIIRDRHLLFDIFLWIASVILILYYWG